MAQNFLFGNLPQLKNDRESDMDILKRSKSKGSKTRTVRTASNIPAGNKYANKLAIAVEHAKSVLVDDGSIKCIRDEKSYFEYIKEMKYARRGGIDTETTGLDPIDDHIVGLCLYTPTVDYAIYVPSMHTDLNDNVLPDQLSYEALIEGLREIQDIPYDYHNAVFDWRFIRNSLGVELKIGWCSQLASNYLNEYEVHQLKPLWDKYVSKKEDPSAKFADLFKGIPFNYVPIEIAYLYGGKDPRITYELAEFQREFLLPESQGAIRKGLSQAGKFLVETEIPLIQVVGRMEDTGIEIDSEYASKLETEYEAELRQSLEEITEIISEYDLNKLPLELRQKLDKPINIGSTQQLAIIFYDLLKLNNGDRKSPRSTDAGALDYIRGKYPEYKKLLDAIQEYRGAGKLLSTYIQKMPALVKKKTGRLHGRFNQYGARTGRFSSDKPNLQNIPSRGKKKKIRKMFRAALKKVFISGDFSQQEPRVLAHLCLVLFGDTRMIDAYLSGKDLYSWMASEIYSVSYEDCKEKHADGSPNPEGKERRASVKEILLGLMYGRQVDSIAELLNIQTKEAQKIMDLVFDTFPAIRKVVDYYSDFAKREGYILTVYGRKCRLPDIQLPKYEFVHVEDKEDHIEDEGIIKYYWSRLESCRNGREKRAIWDDANSRGIWIIDNTMKISDAERQVLNSVVQGTSADITKRAMVLIGEDKLLREWEFDMLMTIHDEVDGECPEENAIKVSERLSEIMISCCADTIKTPMKVDIDISYVWTGEDVTEELRKKYAS